MTNHPWLALHVFHAGDHDALLLDSVQPVVNRLVGEGAIERFFFIRYWNGGPHLRIRIECVAPAQEIELALRGDLQRFLDAHPGGALDRVRYDEQAEQIRSVEERLGAAAVGAIEEVEALQPADSIQARPFYFDERRYGRRAASKVNTLTHAWTSSRIVLAVLQVTCGDAEMKRAFALHAGAVCSRALGSRPPLAAALFDEASKWDLAPDGMSDATRWSRSGFLPYEAQRSALDNVKRLMNDEPVNWPAHWGLLVGAWRDELKRYSDGIHAARGERSHATDAPSDHLLFDALHLLCNRLGVELTSECYVYYLIAELLRETADARSRVRRQA